MRQILTATIVLFGLLSGTADAVTLTDYPAPADHMAYLQSKGAHRPPRCPRVPGVGHPFTSAVFGYNGVALGNNGSADGTIQPYKILYHGQGGVVVWNGHTRRWRNYTRAPVLIAQWCATRSRPRS